MSQCKQLLIVGTYLVCALFSLPLRAQENPFSLPFSSSKINVSCALFLQQEGYSLDEVVELFLDAEYGMLQLPPKYWQGLYGHLVCTYDRATNQMVDVRFVVLANSFEEVQRQLQLIYQPLDSLSYVSLDSFAQSYPDWMNMMSSRLERRIAAQQLALFANPEYRIELWRESFFQSNPAVVILFRAINFETTID